MSTFDVEGGWEIPSPGPVNPLALTVDLEVERVTIQFIRERRLEERTRLEYVADIQDALACLRDDCRLAYVPAVRQDHLAAYLQRLDERRLGVATRWLRRTGLRVFFRFLAHRGYLLAFPAGQLVPPERKELPTYFLSSAECEHLVEIA